MGEGGRWVGAEGRGGLDGAVAEVAKVDEVVLIVDTVELEIHADLLRRGGREPDGQHGEKRAEGSRKRTITSSILHLVST